MFFISLILYNYSYEILECQVPDNYGVVNIISGLCISSLAYDIIETMISPYWNLCVSVLVLFILK